MIISISGIDCELTPYGGAFLHSDQTLLLSDLHFGKDYALMNSGVPIPGGSTRENLSRIRELIVRHKPQRILFLGDLFHAKSGLTDELVLELKIFREEFKKLDFLNVIGNHDRFSGNLDRQIGIEFIPELVEAPFLFLHDAELRPNLFTFSGHIHPSYSLTDTNRQKIRFKVFYLTKNQMILPAFGFLTGGFEIKPEPGSRVIAISNNEIFEVPVSRLYS